MEVKIYHRVDRGMFMPVGSLGPALHELAYTYDIPDGGELPDLESIWRANNRVDGSPVEVVPDSHRSLSVGDVVQVAETSWAVDRVGFEEIDPRLLLTLADIEDSDVFRVVWFDGVASVEPTTKMMLTVEEEFGVGR